MNKEIEKYPIYLLNSAGELIRIHCIKSTDDYNHSKYALHHYIPYQAFIRNPKWYKERGVEQKLILVSHICHEHVHNMGIKQLTDKEFEQKYKISRQELIYTRFSTFSLSAPGKVQKVKRG